MGAGLALSARLWSQVAGANGDIRDQLKSAGAQLAEPFARCVEHLAANQHHSRKYRAPWIVPQLA